MKTFKSLLNKKIVESNVLDDPKLVQVFLDALEGAPRELIGKVFKALAKGDGATAAKLIANRNKK